MLLALVQEAAEHAAEAVTPFRLDPGLIIWTWVVFIALMVLLKRFAWPAIVGLAEERERNIKHQIDEAGKANQDAQAALEEHRQLLAGAKDDAATLVNEAKVTAAKEREVLLARAREEQEELLDRAKREIAIERERAVAELRREAVDLSLAAASRLVKDKFDAESDRKLVQDYLASLEQGT